LVLPSDPTVATEEILRRREESGFSAVRAGDTLVVPKLDRLARSVPDARAIGDDLAGRGIKLPLGGQVYDPADPMGKMFFNILATFAEFSVISTRRDGHVSEVRAAA
jgi:DNA invertase Pin-like site-specific DNA recombinase